MKKSLNYIYASLIIFFLGVGITFAADLTAGFGKNFKDTSESLVNNVLTSASTLLITAAFVLFFYGVVVFIYGRVSGEGDMKKIEDGKSFMIWGLAALFIMVSVWGIIKLAQNVLDIQGNDIQITPVKFAPLDTGGDKPVPKNPLDKPDSANLPPETNTILNGTKTTYADTTKYPIITVGYNNQKFIDALGYKIIAKKCMSSTTSFGSTYDKEHDVPFVKKFQTANGLEANGIVEEKTWGALSTPTGFYSSGKMVKDCS